MERSRPRAAPSARRNGDRTYRDRHPAVAGSARDRSALHPGVPRRLATASASVFAVSGVLTHLCCETVILAYRRAAETGIEPTYGPQPSPRSATTLLAMSAIGALGALAVFSSSLTIEAVRRRSPASSRWAAVTPFPCVMSTLLTFGDLPTPVAGYARPASMSIGLFVYFAVTAASDLPSRRAQRPGRRTRPGDQPRWEPRSATPLCRGSR